MSFFKNDFTRIKVTGLTEGSWTTVNIATLAGAAFKSGSRNVKLKYDSVGTLATTYGARKVGSSDTFTNAANSRVKKDVWVELNSNQIELFIGSNTNGEWYIEGFDTHFTFLTTPIEKGGSTTAGTYTLDYSAELPSDAIGGSVLLELSRGVRIGAYGNVPITAFQPLPRTQVILPLDALRRLQYISSGGTTLDSDLRVVAWAPKDAILHATEYNPRTLTQVNQWTPLPDASTQTVLGLWRLSGGSDNWYWGMRPSDDTTDNDVATGLLNRYTYTKHGADGLTSLNVANIGLSAYYFGGIVETLAVGVHITNVDKLVVGEVTTLTLDSTTFAATTLKISDGAVTKSVPLTSVGGGVYTLIPPVWVDGSTGLKYGAVNLFANDGAEDTPAFAATLSLPAGYSTQIIDSVNSYTASGFLIGTQAVFNTSQAYVYKDGVVENKNSYVGVTQIWDRDPNTRIVTFTAVTVNGDEIILPNSPLRIKPCTDGLLPRYTSLFPDGNRPFLSGGSPALEWITNGNLEHGDLITIRTNVTGLFGEPDLRAQSLSIIGDETVINGVSNNWLTNYTENELLRGYFDGGGGNANGYTGVPLDPNSPYHTIVGAVKTSITRHANINCAFKMSAFNGISNAGTEPGLFSWPKPFVQSNRIPPAGKLFVASWVFYDFDNASEINALQYQSLSGTFQVGSNTKPTRSGNNLVGGIVGLGERCSMVSGQGKNAMGYVKLVADGWGYVEIDNSYVDEWFVADWSNAVVTGTVSGAVMTMGTLVEGTSYYSEGASKSARILQDTVVSKVDTATVIAGVSCGIGINVFYDATNDFANAAPITVSTRAWHRRTIWVDYRVDSNGKIKCGQVIDNNAPQICLIDAHNVRSDIGPVLSNWGIEANVPNAHTAITGELKAYTDNMMCIVSDSSTWSGVNYLNAEPLVLYGVRTPEEATFRLSRGVYSSITGKYLYVLSDPITPINTNGLLLSGV